MENIFQKSHCIQIQLQQCQPTSFGGETYITFFSLHYWFMEDNGTLLYKLKGRGERNDPFQFYASSTWPRGFRWKSLSSVNGLVIIKLWCSLSCLVRGCKMDSFLLGMHTWHGSTYKSSHANETPPFPVQLQACNLIHYENICKIKMIKWETQLKYAIKDLVIGDSIILTTSIAHSHAAMSEQLCCAFISSSALTAMAKTDPIARLTLAVFFKFIHNTFRCILHLHDQQIKKMPKLHRSYMKHVLPFTLPNSFQDWPQSKNKQTKKKKIKRKGEMRYKWKCHHL